MLFRTQRDSWLPPGCQLRALRIPPFCSEGHKLTEGLGSDLEYSQAPHELKHYLENLASAMQTTCMCAHPGLLHLLW